MKYAVIKVINGNYFVHAEGFSDKSKAKVSYHDLLKTLWNAPDVTTAMVMVADENLDVVDGCREYVFHASDEPEDADA